MKRIATIIVPIILCLSLSAATSTKALGAWHHYVGAINKTISIEADISVNGNELSGFYFYAKVGAPISLFGKLSGTFVNLTETDGDANVTGLFTGVAAKGFATIKGSWKTPDGKKNLAFELTENYLSAAALDIVKFTDSWAVDIQSENSPLLTYASSYLTVRGNQKLQSGIEKAILGGTSWKAWLEAASQSFYENYIQDAQATYAENPDDESFEWAGEDNLNLCYNGKGYVCFDFGNYEFIGGAHPMWGSTYYVFDVKTGDRILLKDIFKPDSTEALGDLVTAAIKRNLGLAEEDSLLDAGFYDEQIAPSDSFWVSGEGISFVYSPEEIAPYVLGQSVAYLKWSDLRALLLPNARIPK